MAKTPKVLTKRKLEDVYRKEFKIFKSTVIEYVELLGLKQWEFRIEIKHMDFPENYCQAKYECYMNSKVAFIKLNARWLKTEKPSDQEIRGSAIHEVLEVLLAELSDMLKFTFNEDKVDKKIHEVINSLENFLFYMPPMRLVRHTVDKNTTNKILDKILQKPGKIVIPTEDQS